MYLDPSGEFSPIFCQIVRIIKTRLCHPWILFATANGGSMETGVLPRCSCLCIWHHLLLHTWLRWSSAVGRAKEEGRTSSESGCCWESKLEQGQGDGERGRSEDGGGGLVILPWCQCTAALWCSECLYCKQFIKHSWLTAVVFSLCCMVFEVYFRFFVRIVINVSLADCEVWFSTADNYAVLLWDISSTWNCWCCASVHR